MDNLAGLEAAVEGLNAGAPIATIEPSLIERMWEALSRFPSDKSEPPASSYVGALFDPGLVPSDSEHRVAMMVRYAMLNALIEQGVLDEYMVDEALRKKVFRAAALLPCDKNDLYEAVTERNLSQSSAEVRRKTEEELKQAGYDRDHLKLVPKFMTWLRDRVDL